MSRVTQDSSLEAAERQLKDAYVELRDSHVAKLFLRGIGTHASNTHKLHVHATRRSDGSKILFYSADPVYEYLCSLEGVLGQALHRKHFGDEDLIL